MRLPVLDQYRAPFVEPLGHLVLQAARADNALVELCASCLAREPVEVAHELRNWTQDAKAYCEDAFGNLGEEQRRQALDCLRRFDRLRDQRHRAIHDIVEVGIFGDASSGYSVQPLRLGYRRDGNTTRRHLVAVMPEDVAQLAVEYGELADDLEAIR